MAMSERYLSLTFSSTKINWTRNLFNQRCRWRNRRFQLRDEVAFVARYTVLIYHFPRLVSHFLIIISYDDVSQRSTFIVEHHGLLLRWTFSRFKSQLGLANCTPNRHRALNRVKNSGFQPFFSLSRTPWSGFSFLSVLSPLINIFTRVSCLSIKTLQFCFFISTPFFFFSWCFSSLPILFSAYH